MNNEMGVPNDHHNINSSNNNNNSGIDDNEEEDLVNPLLINEEKVNKPNSIKINEPLTTTTTTTPKKQQKFIGEPVSDEDTTTEDDDENFHRRVNDSNSLLTQTYFSTNLKRSTTGRLSLTEAISANETLEDFEKREREIVQQLHENNQEKEELLNSKNDNIFVPESVQNRQSLVDLSQDSNITQDSSDNETYPREFSLKYPTYPPPAYTIAKMPKNVLEDNQKEDKTVKLDEFNVEENSKKFIPEKANYNYVGYIPDNSDDNVDDNKNNKFGGMSVIKPSINNAIGSSFALAGEMASVVINKNNLKKASIPSHTSSSDDTYNYTDNIRENIVADYKTELKPTPEDVIVSTTTSKPGLKDFEAKYPITTDMKNIFCLIEEFQAERIEIEPILQPFPIDYIPAVGDVDPFIKIPRPDDADSFLGLTVLDEPAAIQSDSAMVELKLQQLSKKGGTNDEPIKKLSLADKNTHQIEKWIDNVKEIRKIKPPDRVYYSKPMPDIEHLMQEWSPEMEKVIKNLKIPNSKLDVPLEEYADLCLAVVDIPIYKSRIQSLHLLFSLYSEFRNSQHFQNLDIQNNLYNNINNGDSKGAQNNRLEL